MILLEIIGPFQMLFLMLLVLLIPGSFFLLGFFIGKNAGYKKRDREIEVGSSAENKPQMK